MVKMTDRLVAEFLSIYNDSWFPEGMLEQYELIECFSHTPIGETYLARDRKSDKLCVIKCREKTSEEDTCAECDELRNIRHANLQVFLDIFENETIRCSVREYIDGQSLGQYIKEHSLSKAGIISILGGVCDALTVLHSQKPAIIHRDIKPENIIITPEGQAVLIDLGIARRLKEEATKDTRHLGTRPYAAPEQYGFRQTDVRSDIYSLGVLLGWMVTGKADPSVSGEEVKDPQLRQIVQKCTAFDPDHRYQNVSEVKRNLLRRGEMKIRPAVVLILVLGMLAISAGIWSIRPQRIKFEEPLIEQAARLTLGLDATQPISAGDLAKIDSIYIWGNHAAANEAEFSNYADQFANNSGDIQRGGIRSLTDLTKMKHITRVYIAYQDLTDIEPLSELTYLEDVDLRHTPVRDVSPLAANLSLTRLEVFDTDVTDLTALRTCPHLQVVDIGMTEVQSMATLDGLDSLKALNIRRTSIRSLDGIESHPLLEDINLSETNILDLTPLLNLPRLQKVEADSALQKNLNPGFEAAGIEVNFK
jgi:serine/threonine protein kinase